MSVCLCVGVWREKGGETGGKKARPAGRGTWDRGRMCGTPGAVLCRIERQGGGGARHGASSRPLRAPWACPSPPLRCPPLPPLSPPGPAPTRPLPRSCDNITIAPPLLKELEASREPLPYQLWPRMVRCGGAGGLGVRLPAAARARCWPWPAQTAAQPPGAHLPCPPPPPLTAGRVRGPAHANGLYAGGRLPRRTRRRPVRVTCSACARCAAFAAAPALAVARCCAAPSPDPSSLPARNPQPLSHPLPPAPHRMAVDKLAEGIENFAADQRKLEDMIGAAMEKLEAPRL